MNKVLLIIVFVLLLIVGLGLFGSGIMLGSKSNSSVFTPPQILTPGAPGSGPNAALTQSISELTKVVPLPEEVVKLLGDENKLRQYLLDHRTDAKELVTSFHTVTICDVGDSGQTVSFLFVDHEARRRYVYCAKIHIGVNDTIFWSPENMSVKLTNVHETNRSQSDNTITIEKKGTIDLQMKAPFCIASIEKLEPTLPSQNELVTSLQDITYKGQDPTLNMLNNNATQSTLPETLFSFGVWITKPKGVSQAWLDLWTKSPEYDALIMLAEMAGRQNVLKPENIRWAYQLSESDVKPGGHFHQLIQSITNQLAPSAYDSINITITPDLTNIATRCDGTAIK